MSLIVMIVTWALTRSYYRSGRSRYFYMGTNPDKFLDSYIGIYHDAVQDKWAFRFGELIEDIHFTETVEEDTEVGT